MSMGLLILRSLLDSVTIALLMFFRKYSSNMFAKIPLTTVLFGYGFSIAFLLNHKLMVVSKAPGAKVPQCHCGLYGTAILALVKTVVETTTLRQIFHVLEQRRDPVLAIAQLQFSQTRAVDEQAAHWQRMQSP